MISEELKFSFKYLLIMIIPATLAYWGGIELMDLIFQEDNPITPEEIISKATTIVFAISLIRFLKKDKVKMYEDAPDVTPITLVYNAVLFVFLGALILLGIKVIFNVIGNLDAFTFSEYSDFALNLLILSVLTIINLTKNIKYFGERD